MYILLTWIEKQRRPSTNAHLNRTDYIWTHKKTFWNTPFSLVLMNFFLRFLFLLCYRQNWHEKLFYLYKWPELMQSHCWRPCFEPIWMSKLIPSKNAFTGFITTSTWNTKVHNIVNANSKIVRLDYNRSTG